uniref:PNPLA domain-containing protein n=1 Tax=Attheya septentrionalis TaxID=420275 RepID=A0A7S2XI65_9STRA|mmetsp:Transcript_114/g.184  ORF Transcript_114/g.184 Transcript_114/m.184 type:complete len:668 (+) Transcript_114:145-2148(+)
MKFSASLVLTAALLDGVTGLRTQRKLRVDGDHETIGLALTGGSLTAANIGGAVMRGFQQHKVTIDGEEITAMEAFDYVSALSGGNFPSIMYHYAQNTTSDEILDAGGISDPSLITTEELETIPENSMFHTFVTSIIPSFMAAFAFALLGASFWPTMVYIHFLAPYGIPPNMPMGKEKTTEDHVVPRSEIKSTPVVEFSMTGPANLYPNFIWEQQMYGLAEDVAADFDSIPEADDPAFQALVVELGGLRPGKLLNNSDVLEIAKQNGCRQPVPFFGTPGEIRSQFMACEMTFDPVGNATSEAINFEPFSATPEELSTETDVYSLEKLLGMGTQLVPIMLASLGSALPRDIVDVIEPPIQLDIPTADGVKREVAIADGGYNDGTGIPALVQLKVRKIISVQTITGAYIGDTSSVANPVLSAVTKMTQFFGLVFDPSEFGVSPTNFGVAQKLTNKIFELTNDAESQLVKYANDMFANFQAGNPLVATFKDLNVVDNPFWGTEAGNKVDLTVILMLGVPEKFSSQVPQDVAPPPEGRNFTEYGFFTNEELRLVPNTMSARTATIDLQLPEYNISFSGVSPIPEFALDVKEARMTQILGSWIVKEAWNGLEGPDGESTFGGFNAIFGGESSGFRSEGDYVRAEDPPNSGAGNIQIYTLMYTVAASLFLSLIL